MCRAAQRRQRRRLAVVAAAAAPPGAEPEANEDEEEPFSFGPPPTVDIEGRPIQPGHIGIIDDPSNYIMTNPDIRADRAGQQRYACGAGGGAAAVACGDQASGWALGTD